MGQHANGDEWWEYGVEVPSLGEGAWAAPIPPGHTLSQYGDVKFLQINDSPRATSVRVTSTKSGYGHLCTFTRFLGGVPGGPVGVGLWELVSCEPQGAGVNIPGQLAAKMPYFPSPIDLQKIVSTKQRFAKNIEQAARAADAELKKRGKRLMAPLDDEETALILKHLGVTSGAESLYARAAVQAWTPGLTSAKRQD